MEIIIILIILIIILLALLQSKTVKSNSGVKVTVENFVVSETHMYIKKYFERIGQVNTFFHHRDFEIDNSVIRMNLDTLYSIAIIDLNTGPVSINLPQIDDRYLSFQCSYLFQPRIIQMKQERKLLIDI